MVFTKEFDAVQGRYDDLGVLELGIGFLGVVEGRIYGRFRESTVHSKYYPLRSPTLGEVVVSNRNFFSCCGGRQKVLKENKGGWQGD